MIILVLPEVVAGLWFLRLPESPRFFVAKGDPRKALVVLRRMFAVNTGRQAKDFPVRNLLEDVRIETRIRNNLQCRGKTVKALQEMGAQFRRLFRAPLLYVTMLTTSIMFTNMFGYVRFANIIGKFFTNEKNIFFMRVVFFIGSFSTDLAYLLKC